MESSPNASTSTSSSGGNAEEYIQGGKSITLTRRRGIENPFTFKVGQVFTGFGVGCGLGIGVGRPLNLGAIPVLNQVMSAASGATYAFSGIGRQVNNSLKKFGAKNIEAGIGCGVGFGHGFGVGLAVKPGVIHQMQCYLVEAVGKLMIKFGAAPDLSIGLPVLPTSIQNGMNMVAEPSAQQLNVLELGRKVPKATSRSYEDRNPGSHSGQFPFSGQSENLVNKILKNPVLGEIDTELNETVGQLESENRVLHMVLKHQQIIEELMEQNEKLRRILVEDLKVSPSKLKQGCSNRNSSSCTDCFDCRRKQRRR